MESPLSIAKQNNPFLSIQNALDRAMDNFFEDYKYPLRELDNLAIFPAIDIVEDKDKFKVEAEMPGLDEKNVKVSISDGILIIKGEKKISKKDKDENYRMREISYGYYERNIPLPDYLDTSKAKATFKKGMIWIDIPKKPEAIQQAQSKVKEIPVEKAS